ncbi:UDP-N-acetylmuramoyl-tripeptide--D-alanyl-D-alanine ligase [Qingshengfaniella alkalisoli]|uniref:UDP-N-acetylmuramoyl-tripeptide--D-alanyl-D-alanine ligase n=1 Tax=Qingshengfaniella alkalisoli TaxID=2599296 RepID=A0A5B8I957_9RHOB|nr:UDP-N-acetylmuramoyl-tripeptide--D-alanyl-D-alanine ligase [Qingshengfaniella alkalisoli]QDY69456.1 UDP-N-acetylmuramoyl-tripeptide--D-alanyl-D-alanine ligase [Qingshengfaniella alkalisoli]
MSAPLWTASEARAATGGEAQGDWTVSSISIDTREIEPGALFVALTDRRDGHDFVADALAKGAAAALVSRRPEGVAEDAPLLIVEDVMDGLRALAISARTRLKGQVIAVTGSVGKTSTKEMLRCIFAEAGKVHAAERSFNNHWGVPLTLARCPADADFVVIEIGMNNPGEIAPLSDIARPDVAMVTTVAPAHMAAFSSVDDIAREKGQIISGLVSGGAAVLNGDVPTASILAGIAQDKGARVVCFGTGDTHQARLLDMSLTDMTTEIHCDVMGQTIAASYQVPAEHFALNAVAALTASSLCGVALDVAAIGLAKWTPPKGRGTRETVVLSDGGQLELIDDAYNANPVSLAASLRVLATSEPKGGRRVAILGDMLELGGDENAVHAAIAELPSVSSIDVIHCVGSCMAHLWQALPDSKRGRSVETSDQLLDELPELVSAGDIVLLKGSLGSKIGILVDALRQIGEARASHFRRQV